MNLLQNTVDAVIRRQITHPEVRIHEYKQEDFLVVEISDNAGGLPDTIAENIFSLIILQMTPDWERV